jgi:hypothetical protein
MGSTCMLAAAHPGTTQTINVRSAIAANAAQRLPVSVTVASTFLDPKTDNTAGFTITTRTWT